jgi:hypothetical protein
MGKGTLIHVNKYGPFGIADATGRYTYYPDLYSAVAAASPGQVVEAFANFVETSNEVTLSDQVDINLNGYTYTLDSAGSENALTNAGSVGGSCRIYNGVIARVNAATGGDGHATVKITNTTFNIELYGVTLTNNVCFVISDTEFTNSSFTGKFIVRCTASSPQAAVYNLNSSPSFNGAGIISDGPCILGPSGSSVSLFECTLGSIGSGAISQDGNVEASYTKIISLAGVSVQSSKLSLQDCSVLTLGFSCTTGKGAILNSTLFSSGANTIEMTGLASQNVRIFSNLIQAFAGRAINSSFSSGVNAIIGNDIFTSGGTGVACTMTGGGDMNISQNNIVASSGTPSNIHGILATRTGAAAVILITDNIIRHIVPSLTAYALNSGAGSLSINFFRNTLSSLVGADVYGPNVIQGQVNTIDNFANIRIG